MSSRLSSAASLAAALLAASTAAGFEPAAAPADAAKIEFFEKKVRPLLVANCYDCHSANTNSKGGLRVDDRNGLLTGGERGPAIVPGKPEESLLIKAVVHDDKLKMPPEYRLEDEQIEVLKQWIADGAAWPAVEHAVAEQEKPEFYERLRKEHWAWQPLTKPAVPEVTDARAAEVRDDVDRFVLAKLAEKGLTPVAEADKTTLIRRVTFDLTGLPPTPEEIDLFLADESPEAFEKVVDRLLASPAFGERWGRHWLDVARYAESSGGSRNLPYPHAWRYRDYVVDAFNKDKPYDRFIREQVAGDLLPAESQTQRDESVVATGFLAIGVKDVNQRFKVRFIMDNIDEKIDAVGRAFLGLTASCARCHDHKFDPISREDYYALAGIFHSTDDCSGLRNKMGGGGLDYYDTSLLIPLGDAGAKEAPSEEKIAEVRAALKEARAEQAALRDNKKGDEIQPDGRKLRVVIRQKVQKLQNELIALTDPAASGPIAQGVRDQKDPHDTEIRIRGEAEALGPIVPRGFLSVVSYPGQPTVNRAQSGRVELAEWLSSAQNPLTSRVMVNRVWQHLFGEGIVLSVDNFGSTGDRPSHPELLDHLANRFIDNGWSVKKLIRSIVLSRTYRQGSEAIESNVAVDPANRFVWRHAPRRLDAEELRDAALVASGSLDAARPEGSPAAKFRVSELRNNGPEARALLDGAQASPNRSVYLPLLRGVTPTSLAVFDFAEQGMVTGRRDVTTVAPQALYMLNDPFVRRESVKLAEKLLAETSLDDEARVTRAYRVLLGRRPTESERERVKVFLADYEAAASEVLAATPAAEADANQVAAAETAGNVGGGSNAADPVATPAPANATPAEAPAPADPNAAVAAAGTNGAAKPAPAPNPDAADQTDAPVKEEVIPIKDAKTAAWAGFVQALIAAGEFRYVQ